MIQQIKENTNIKNEVLLRKIEKLEFWEWTQVEWWLWKVNRYCSQGESKKSPPPLRSWHFFIFSLKWLRIFNQFFTHLSHNPIFARLQIFIQLYPTLTKLGHIKRDCLVHVIHSKCPPSAEMHAFRRLRKSLTALLIVVCSTLKHFYNENKHVGYDMTSTVTSYAQ